MGSVSWTVALLLFCFSGVCSKGILYHVCLLTSDRPQSYVKHSIRSLYREGFSTMSVIDADGASGFGLNVSSFRKLADCVDDGKDVVEGVPCKVQQSNYDVAMALWVCDSHARKAKWILFVEDDMEACAGSLKEVKAALKSSVLSAVQFSKFSRAFAVRRGASVLDLVSSIRCQAHLAPYDVVLWNTFPARTITRNLFHHMGTVSTIQYRNEDDYLAAYSHMRSDVCGQKLD